GVRLGVSSRLADFAASELPFAGATDSECVVMQPHRKVKGSVRNQQEMRPAMVFLESVQDMFSFSARAVESGPTSPIGGAGAKRGNYANSAMKVVAAAVISSRVNWTGCLRNRHIACTISSRSRQSLARGLRPLL